MPSDLYRRLLTALDAQMARDVAVVPSPVAPVMVGEAPAPMVAPLVAPDLSPDVLAACARFAFGSRDELQANQRQARAFKANGLSDGQIIAAIRDGASLPAWAGAL